MTEILYRAEIDSPIGAMIVIHDGVSVVVAEFTNREDRVRRQLARYYATELEPAGATPTPSALPEPIARAFADYFAGGGDELCRVEAAPRGTPFELRVWAALAEIPCGETRTYGELAAALQSSARAIGRANGRNPLTLIRPCHRVIGADGTLVGYAGGLARKRWLLAHESKHAAKQTSSQLTLMIP